MVLRSLILAGVACSFSTVSFAQDSVSTKLDELSRKLDGLGQQVGTIQTQLGLVAAGPQLTPAPSLPPQPHIDPRTIIQRLVDVEQKVADLDRTQQELNFALEDISEQTAGGKRIVDVRGLMEEERGRSAMKDAVDSALRIQRNGNLVVDNKLNTQYQLLVNKQSHVVPPNRKTYIAVPVGTVSVELVGYESPKYFSIGAPDYEQSVTISMAIPRRTQRMPLPRYVWQWDPWLGWVQVLR